ncbi:hypothetical protein [Candidatus Marithrix sp. Canyon 246]|uniref:hypothetical protein n=1 Tax=Candidatus Marithrix sp. Canyon 246 TaxID=1827136 RepID=UPI00084A0D75|nr:hypothetical protein [Candidatus Marithrix sp. Canyon 246]
MKHDYINLSISSIIAMMVFAIYPATLAETELDILDANYNALFSDQDIISVHSRRHRHRHGHHRRHYYDDRYNTY